MGGGDLKLHLGSANGLPFLTNKDSVPYYKKGDMRSKPQQVRKARVDVFDLSDEAAFIDYRKIWEAAGYGLVTVVEEDKQWVETKENWKVFIRWFVNGKMDPSELRTTKLQSIRDLYTDVVENQETDNASSQSSGTN